MRIKSLLLENIRSHVKTLINFREGFTCLVGGLGQGKSSILYAIDFALFGDPLGRSYSYLIREGADIGKVALKFVKDGREYTIWRALRRRGESITQDMEQLKLFRGERLIAEVKSDAVAEQLKAITGIDREVFREVIWVRQERLKELLDMTPRERQKKLDQLFGLSDYDASWANLRPIIRRYEDERDLLERDPDVVRIEEFVNQYNEAVRELAEKKMELENLRNQLSISERRLQEAMKRLERLEAARRRNEELRSRKNRLQTRIVSIEDQSGRMAIDIDEKRRRLKELHESLEALKGRMESERKILMRMGLSKTQVEDIQQLQSYMDAVMDQVSSIQAEQETARREVRNIRRRISTLTEESRCPLCLQELPQTYKDGLLKRLREEASEYEAQLRELERNVKELNQMRGTLSAAIATLRELQVRVEDTERRIREEEASLNRLTGEFQKLQGEEEKLRVELAELEAEITEIDVEEIEEAQRMRDEAYDEYSNLKHKVQSVEEGINQISLRMENLRERLDNAEKKIERVKRVRRILELLQEVRQAYRSIQPRLRSDFIRYLERIVQQVLDELMGGISPLTITIGDDYTPYVKSEDGYERTVNNLSGGERTLLAFAYRLTVGQLIMQARVGHGLTLLILDEPTESLGREDGSIDRLAEALSNLKTVEQLIAVTHSEAFAEKADHVIRVSKTDNVSSISVER